jgi:PAP2 superfamily
MPSRARHLLRRLLPKGPGDLLKQLVLMAAAYELYRLVRGMADDPAGAAVAFQNARNLISVEQTLHLFVEPAVQSWADSLPLVSDVSSWLYINAQTSITLGALAFIYLRHNRSFYFVRNMFAVAWVVALAGYALYPTAPPRLFPEWGFFDAVSAFTGIQDTDRVSTLFNAYAAVPSMHVCFSLMIGVPLFALSRHRFTRLFWATYPLLVTFVIVTTANHFLADAFLGACTAGIAALAARQLGRLRPGAWTFEAPPSAAHEPAGAIAPAPLTA